MTKRLEASAHVGCSFSVTNLGKLQVPSCSSPLGTWRKRQECLCGQMLRRRWNNVCQSWVRTRRSLQAREHGSIPWSVRINLQRQDPAAYQRQAVLRSANPPKQFRLIWSQLKTVRRHRVADFCKTSLESYDSGCHFIAETLPVCLFVWRRRTHECSLRISWRLRTGPPCTGWRDADQEPMLVAQIRQCKPRPTWNRSKWHGTICPPLQTWAKPLHATPRIVAQDGALSGHGRQCRKSLKVESQCTERSLVHCLLQSLYCETVGTPIVIPASTVPQ